MKNIYCVVFAVLFFSGCGQMTEDSGECLPQCPESENSTEASDIPCGTDDGDDATIEESCFEIQECGGTFYCRATGF